MYALSLKGDDEKDILFFVARGKSQIRRMLTQCAPNIDVSEAITTCVRDIGDGGAFFVKDATDMAQVGKDEMYIGDNDEENI